MSRNFLFTRFNSGMGRIGIENFTISVMTFKRLKKKKTFFLKNEEHNVRVKHGI